MLPVNKKTKHKLLFYFLKATLKVCFFYYTKFIFLQTQTITLISEYFKAHFKELAPNMNKEGKKGVCFPLF